MKTKIILLTSLIVSQLAFAQINKGIVKGIVKTSDGQRAPMVSVSLKGTTKGSAGISYSFCTRCQ